MKIQDVQRQIRSQNKSSIGELLALKNAGSRTKESMAMRGPEKKDNGASGHRESPVHWMGVSSVVYEGLAASKAYFNETDG